MAHTKPTRILITSLWSLVVAGVIAVSLMMAYAPVVQAQSAGAVTITIDENLGSTYGVAEVVIDGEAQGVLSAGCCMFLQVSAGSHDMTLRWPDYEVTTDFESDGHETIAFHLTAERALILLEE